MTDVIAAVEENRRGALISMESGEKLWLSREALCEHAALRPGDELNLEELKAWLLPRQYPEALNTAVALLAQQARASGEIRKKLERKPYLEDTIDMVLYKLEKEKLLNDQEFAREWAASRARCQVGRNRILQELLQKGVDRDTARMALDEMDEEEKEEAAVALACRLVKRHAKETDERKAMNKVLMARARRGYCYDESRCAIEKALLQMEEEA